MTIDIGAMRDTLKERELTPEELTALLDLAQAQQVIITELERKALLAQTWVRTHYHGRQKAEKALLDCVRRVVRDSAKLARGWPKYGLEDCFAKGQKPTKEQVGLSRLVAGNIAQHILRQLEVE